MHAHPLASANSKDAGLNCPRASFLKLSLAVPVPKMEITLPKLETEEHDSVHGPLKKSRATSAVPKDAESETPAAQPGTKIGRDSWELIFAFATGPESLFLVQPLACVSREWRQRIEQSAVVRSTLIVGRLEPLSHERLREIQRREPVRKLWLWSPWMASEVEATLTTLWLVGTAGVKPHLLLPWLAARPVVGRLRRVVVEWGLGCKYVEPRDRHLAGHSLSTCLIAPPLNLQGQ